MPIKKKILILNNSVLYDFISFILQEDGSFYVFLLKKGKVQKRLFRHSEEPEVNYEYPNILENATRKISYHASGVVGYGKGHPRIFCDPIVDIKQKNLFGIYMLPSLASLDVSLEKNTEEHYIIELNNEAPYEFNLFLAPWNTCYKNAIHFINDFFSFVIESTVPSISIPEGANDGFFIPEKGIYEKQQMPQDLAYTSFHQKKNNLNSPKLILYPPNREGMWKIVCSCPMRTSPRLAIEFKDKSLSFEIVEVKNYFVTFKVKGKAGYFKTLQHVEIIFFTLDARLGIV